MNKLNLIFARAAVLFYAICFLWSCGDSDTFTIQGTVDGNPTMNLRYIYFANHTLQSGITAARQGKFEFKGSATEPAVLEILDNDYRPMARLYVVNGDRIECRITRNNPYLLEVNGSDVNSRWAAFLRQNAEKLSGSGANSVIEKYVAANPDDLVSTLLMVTSYDASRDGLRADSIITMINQDVRPASLVDGFNAMLQRLVAHTVNDPVQPITFLNRRDSLVDFRPSARRLSLLALTDATSGRNDSILPALKRLSRKSLRRDVQIAELSADRDTLTWRNDIRNDSAAWKQGWVAGSISAPGIDRLGIPSVPYFIVVDSSGCQKLRTPSVTDAEQYIDSCVTVNR